MRPLLGHPSLFSTILLLPSFSAAIGTFDCKNIVTDGVKFNLEPLGGIHSVAWARDHEVNIMNTTITVDVCKPLPDGSKKVTDTCPQGTHICAKEDILGHDGKMIIENFSVKPIARQYTHDNANLNAKKTRLKAEDPDTEGLQVELGGGEYKVDLGGGKSNTVKEKAIIKFICKSKKERRVRWDDEKDGGDKDDDKPKEGDDKHRHEDWDAFKKTDDGKGGTLEFISFIEGEKEGVLNLEWRTYHACEEAASIEPPSSGGWGFFSWFFFLIFMGGLAYFAFFAWVNYTRYGAQGWDLVPHADALRDLPYILGDWIRKVVGTFTGGGSRGGYSAV